MKTKIKTRNMESQASSQVKRFLDNYRDWWPAPNTIELENGFIEWKFHEPATNHLDSVKILWNDKEEVIHVVYHQPGYSEDNTIYCNPKYKIDDAVKAALVYIGIMEQ